MKSTRPRGFTLVELLVTVSIISMLAGILLPVFAGVRRRTRSILGVNNQRQIVSGVNIFAADNGEFYPESVATVGMAPGRWNWQEPMMLTSYKKRTPQLQRSVSAYLKPYIRDASTMFCPNAPREYKYLQEAWDAADNWNNPDTPLTEDAMIGTYCLYWNYTGFLGGRRGVFNGPRGPGSCGGQSTVLVSDYFGYDHWRSRGAFSSCEQFKDAHSTSGTWISSDLWSSSPAELRLDEIQITLHAGYTDGRVESFAPFDVVPMEVSITSDGSEPYPEGVGPGVFYLPRNALH